MKKGVDADAISEYVTPTYDADVTERENELAALLPVLSDRERDIVKLRFGLEDGKPMTLAEVGTCFGVTRERVRQIEHKALAKMRKCADRKLKKHQL